MIGIIDYNAGNIPSVARALSSLGLDFLVSKKPSDLQNAERIIFPGVGDAQFAMQQLKNSGFDEFLHTFAASGRPLLGICLGSQIIFTHSQEGNTDCLNLIEGHISHFDVLLNQAETQNRLSHIERISLKIPHMGWNDISYTQDSTGNTCPLFKGIAEHSSFYFVHSYLIQPDDLTVIAGTTDYGIPVPAVIQKNNIYAAQFHPEKSAQNGLRFLQNFAEVSSC